MNVFTQSDYEKKDIEYFENDRSELLHYVPEGRLQVLDVGCGAGKFGKLLKERFASTVWGVEPDLRAANIAKSRLDRVFSSPFGEGLNLPDAYFDLVCFNDVLEHMSDPVSALRYAKTLLKPGGQILASVPNFRQFNNLWKIAVRGQATYESSGIMDRTHLRIFTFKSFKLLFEEAGLEVKFVHGINSQYTHWLFWVLNVVTLGRAGDMRWLQIVAVSNPLNRATDL